MRRLVPIQDEGRAYAVVTAPAAWHVVGRLPRDVYQRILDALADIADVARIASLIERECRHLGSLVTHIGEWIVEYDVNHQTRVVVLLDVRQMPEGDQG